VCSPDNLNRNSADRGRGCLRAGAGQGDQMTKLDVTYVGGKDGEDVYRVGASVLEALAKAELKEWGRKR
jgi:hypothetical protein